MFRRHMLEAHPLVQARLQKVRQLEDGGLEPYPARWERTHACSEAVQTFEAAEQADGQLPALTDVRLAGRIVSALRRMGGATFAIIRDGSGTAQVLVRRNQLGDLEYERFRDLYDTGDFIGVRGRMMRTRRGHVTLEAREVTMLAKALHPQPEKWHGLKDVEERYRKRYLDLINNPEVREIFDKRTRIVAALRRFLDARGFVEVETPILQPLYGGATAEPFVTHYRALDRPMYLRIANELYLKRLIIGGYDKVFEIGKDFRNEGLSSVHNPEFTQLEAYQAFADYSDIMDLVEQMLSSVAQEVLGKTVLSYRGHEVDLAPPWRRTSLRQAILEHARVDISRERRLADLSDALERRGLKIERQTTWGRLVDKVLSECVEPNLIRPTLVYDYPTAISPLARRRPDDPHTAERFEIFIGGMELGNAFSELNDPIDQRRRFEQLGQMRVTGDMEVHPIDEDFITALMYGMPPTGGLGIGVDRLTMLFTDQASIREVILFPQLRQPP